MDENKFAGMRTMTGEMQKYFDKIRDKIVWEKCGKCGVEFTNLLDNGLCWKCHNEERVAAIAKEEQQRAAKGNPIVNEINKL
jgi:uncharacterized OB-fold protein